MPSSDAPKRRPTKVQIIKCTYCDGHGKHYAMRHAPSVHRAIRAMKYAWGTCAHCEGTGKRKQLVFSEIISMDINPETGKIFGIVPNPRYDAAPDVFLYPDHNG